MATVVPTALTEVGDAHRVSVIRLSIATGLSATATLALCWVGTFVPVSSPTHAYIGLFVGAVFALIYNATAPLGRR